eukprot:CAMPEP_0116879818 /NCGR_PEP_ID=MMETSP0463-20121206/11654_1 /TAXON_ID=181622 /ORGANISM="Strombidinopsis sp, Strain SopsisLIS2011" /LENGTH=127 /DNA_ID=CAMNT_0004529591 /DNA_START=637 /DNA_END=1020 /DNA_ORIENTATION=+
MGKVYTKYDKVVLENAKVTLFGLAAFNLDTEQFEMQETHAILMSSKDKLLESMSNDCFDDKIRTGVMVLVAAGLAYASAYCWYRAVANKRQLSLNNAAQKNKIIDEANRIEGAPNKVREFGEPDAQI